MKINETQLRKIISESVKNVLRENGEYEALISLMNKVYKCIRVNLAAEIGGNRHEVMRGENNSILVINRDNPKDGVKISFDYIQGGLNESAFYPNYPENTIENTIWNQYSLPWNQVEDSPESYNGVWFISVDYFDYTAHLGNAKAYGKFKSLEECLEYAQNFSFEAAYDLYCEQLSFDEDDEGFTSISLNIMCKCEDGTYEVANTKLYKPN